MTTSYYSTGTVTVTNGSTAITGTGTAWQTALITGGNVFVQAIGNPMPIAAVVDDTHITSELQWTGATGTYSYRIQRDTAYLKTLDANSAALASYLSHLAVGDFYGPANILGTVSQSAGVPTGAVIEQGSNANGRYVKYADGTMMCWHTSTTLNTASTVLGALFVGTLVTLTFPVAFSSVPVVLPTAARSSSTSGAVWAYLANTTPTTTQVSLNILSSGTGGTAYPAYIAIGRWF